MKNYVLHNKGTVFMSVGVCVVVVMVLLRGLIFFY